MSAEHGQSQRKITELLTEYIPTLVDDRLPTIVLLDEVESMAVARSEAIPRRESCRRTPSDGRGPRCSGLERYRIDARDVCGDEQLHPRARHRLHSRVDVAIHMPAPDTNAALAILKKTLESDVDRVSRLSTSRESPPG